MATTSTRWLDSKTLNTGDRSDASADLGEATELEIVVTVSGAADGDSPALCIYHSPSSADDDPLEFREPCRVSLARTGRVWISVPRFTRYLSWRVAGTLDSPGVVTVDLVGR